MTAAGELRHRLVLEAPVETPDGAGGVTRSFAVLATLWAKVTPVSVRERMEAAARGATVTHRIVIRFRDDVTTRHRLRAGARIFRIVALRDQDGRGLFTTIDAEERVD
ncbi:MAG: phage head closure protein [Xanthobacteraceae bacterium]